MSKVISNSLVKQLKPIGRQYDVRDSTLKGFMARVNKDGSVSYVCEYKRGRRITIGNAAIMSSAQARAKAKEILGNAAQGIDPIARRGLTKPKTLKDFIDHQYEAWALLNIKTGEKTVRNIKRCFYDSFGKKEIKDINIYGIENWRNQRLKSGISKATINRDLTTLKAAFSKAVEWELIEEHPLRKLKPLKIDSDPMVRYLSKTEERLLRDALDNREQKIIKERKNANQWRESRGYEKFPDISKLKFVDHLKPMVLLSLNTGLRQGELFNLTWSNVNLNRKILTVSGAISKSSKTRYIPLNDEAYKILESWHKQSQIDVSVVFPNKTNEPFDNVRSSWEKLLKDAGIKEFRWHDMRHHFASRLVMAGVDLNTVRELLGHSEISMTLRYAHLAPEHKADAVAKLNFL